MSNPEINIESLKSEIRSALINPKVIACPMAVRLAWHAAGTYDKKDGSGGSNGAGMRFEPESTDPANAGLHILQSMLHPIKVNHPELSYADLWAISGCAAIEFLGGPKIQIPLGRSDAANGTYSPPNGRLPDAAQGAAHLREVFYRMGFNDQEIVALSGAHTLGSCHRSRSGFEGPWTRNPLKFDNGFFKNLLYLEWRPKVWDGPLQYEDVDTGELMMLPTDMALRTDPAFRVFAEMYAKDQDLFFQDFTAAFAKLLTLCVKPKVDQDTPQEKANAELREAAMHGNIIKVKNWFAKGGCIHSVERSSGRTALHKASFWGHENVIKFLLSEGKGKLNVNVQDYNGDTPLHDAVKINHPKVVALLLAANVDTKLKNKQGKDVLAIAKELGFDNIVGLLTKGNGKL